MSVITTIDSWYFNLFSYFDIFLFTPSPYKLMKRTQLFMVIILSLVAFQYFPSSSKAAVPVVEDGDLLAFSYSLTANTTLIEAYTEENPRRIRVLSATFTPPGLFKGLEGMSLGSTDDITVYPDEGFLPTDPDYGFLAGLTLYYTHVKILEINGVYYTDLPTGGTEPGTFGYYAIRVGLGLLGAAAFAGLVWGGYKLYPKVLGKRCVVCKSSAIGICVKCGRKFCDRCYSNGCPYCKARTLKRFKTSS